MSQSASELSHDPQLSEFTVSRRRWTRAGVALIGALALQGVRQRPAQATWNVGCCTLAMEPGGCPGSGAAFTCPDGYESHSWFCCYSGRLMGCGECTTGSDCWQGTFACSEYWYEPFSC